HLEGFTGPQVLVSEPVAIPAANREYAATVTGRGQAQPVALQVLDSASGTVVAKGQPGQAWTGYAAVAQWTPTTTRPVKLRTEVKPAAGHPGVLDLDYAAVLLSQDFGIMTTTTWPAGLPGQYRRLPKLYQRAANFTLRNGSVVQ